MGSKSLGDATNQLVGAMGDLTLMRADALRPPTEDALLLATVDSTALLAVEKVGMAASCAAFSAGSMDSATSMRLTFSKLTSCGKRRSSAGLGADQCHNL